MYCHGSDYDMFGVTWRNGIAMFARALELQFNRLSSILHRLCHIRAERVDMRERRNYNVIGCSVRFRFENHAVIQSIHAELFWGSGISPSALHPCGGKAYGD